MLCVLGANLEMDTVSLQWHQKLTYRVIVSTTYSNSTKYREHFLECAQSLNSYTISRNIFTSFRAQTSLKKTGGSHIYGLNNYRKTMVLFRDMCFFIYNQKALCLEKSKNIQVVKCFVKKLETAIPIHKKRKLVLFEIHLLKQWAFKN